MNISAFSYCALCWALLVNLRASYSGQTSARDFDAFVISMDSARLRHTKYILESYGMSVEHVQPYNPTSKDVVDFLASEGENKNLDHVSVRQAVSLTLAHKNIMHKISQFTSEKWCYIFEDDVTFGQVDRFQLHNFFKNHSAYMTQEGFMYLGICGPVWYSKSIANFEGYQVRRGIGQCSHAYAVTPRWARNIFPLVMQNAKYILDEWVENHHAATKWHYDLLLKFFFLRHAPKPAILGSNIVWSRAYSWYGLSYQDRQQFPSSINHDYIPEADRSVA